MIQERTDIIRDKSGFETPDIHSSSNGYANRFSGETGQWFISVQESVTDSLIEDLTLSTALDVGGGHGQNIEILTKKNYKITILSSNKNCANLIQPYLERDEVDFKIGPITKIPLSDACFDLVVSYRMLTHLVEWQRHISELCRVSRYSVIVEFPVHKGFNKISNTIFRAKRSIEKNTRPYTLFRENIVHEEFLSQGFQLVGRQAQFFFPMALHRLLDSNLASRLMELLPRLTGLTSRFGSPVIARYDRI